jgi:prevent-host-death family protein
MTQIIVAAEFKATCLAVLDVVAESGEEVVITKRGQPVARLVPILAPTKSLVGWVTYASADDVTAPVKDAWDADQRSPAWLWLASEFRLVHEPISMPVW